MMPDDFPAIACNRVWAKVVPIAASRNDLYAEFASAWNAVSFRYLGMVQDGDAFTKSIIADGTSPPAERRFHQEKCLFDFFSSGFSAIDSFFYAAFALGALVDPAAFPFANDAARRKVKVSATVESFGRRFPTGQPLAALQAAASSPEYTQWRNVRNILTHRAAPGRKLYVSFDKHDETPVDRWQPFDIPLDRDLTTRRRAQLSILLSAPMTALADFAEAHL